MIEIVVHDHALKHGLTREEIGFAWRGFICQRHRRTPHSDQVVTVGVTQEGVIVEMVAVERGNELLIYHALTPPTKSVLRELGLVRRQ
ncbi:hypothetical protein [uncultured Adlercreutzia sp.]|uniref:hypothetical protein n=1 Tax=uncultured Adlercreutzia sp. TaxID=875803 RepID=UPI00267692AF|nr:hypothetical protein [uncultured Adlercreutzia sp.]